MTKTKNSWLILPLVAAMTLLTMTSVSCSKENPEQSEMIQTVQQDPASEQEPSEPDTPEQPVEKPSKYKPEELVTVTFTADSETTKTALADNGRSVVWTLDDEVLFVWGPDEEDRRIGVATEISEDGKRATFTVEAYEGAQAIYAVYPAAAFSSFEKLPAYDTDGSGTVRVSVGAMADGTRTNGTFGQADVCIGRSSLESGKMKFKHLVAFVTMTATQPATARVRLDGLDLVNVGGTLPVTVGVGEDGFTGTPSLGSLEDAATSVTVDAAGVDGSTKTWIPVVPNMSFASGIQLSFLDVNDQVIGQATLRKSTTVALGYELTFPATLNTQFAKDFYVKANADGSGDGSSWDSPWTAAQMAGYLGTAHSEAGLAAGAPVNFHVAAGNYSQAFTPASQTIKDGSAPRPFNILCGYPSDITVANAASKPANPASNPTIFSGSGFSAGSHVWSFTTANTFQIRGMTVSGYSGGSTNDTAVYLLEPVKGTTSIRGTFRDCVFTENDNETNMKVAAAVCVIDGCNASFVGCTFSDNHASAGAALNVDGGSTATLADCTFSENTVSGHQSNNNQDCGGAVKAANCTFTATNTTFSENGVEAAATVGHGGALWVIGNSTNVTLSGCTFTDNYVANATGKGGAVFLQSGSLTLDDVTFSGNGCTAAATTTGGGAVFIGYDSYKSGGNATLTVSDCTFDANTLANRGSDKATSPGGGAFYIDPASGKTVTCSFTRTTFSNHVLNDMNGGVFYAKGGTLDFAGCTFEDNDTRWSYESAPGNVNTQRKNTGSALHIEGGTCTFRDSTLFLTNSTNAGGVIILASTASADTRITIDKCRFHQNAQYNGSGCVLRDEMNSDTDVEHFSVSNSRFSRNTATVSGAVAAIFQNSGASFSNCSFSYNSASSFGGAIYVAGETSFAVSEVASVTVSDCVFDHNDAQGGGGAIEVSQNGSDSSERYCKANIDISGSTFLENQSYSYGGAVGLRTSGICTLTDCIFDGNFTTNSANQGKGGALSIREGNKSGGYTGDVTVTGCVFKGNHTLAESGSTQNGGAVQINSYSAVSGMVIRFNKNHFYANYSNQGGAIWMDPGSADYTLYLNDCVFDKNYITNNYGSTLRLNNCHVYMNNCTIHDTYFSNGTGRYGAWVNLDKVDGVFSNNTLIGQTQRTSGDTGTTTKSTDPRFLPALFRLDWYDSADYTLYFINNIFAPTQDWVYSIIQNRSNGGTQYSLDTRFYANKMGPTVPYVDESTTNDIVAITNKASDDGVNSFNYRPAASCFGSLAWTSPASDKDWTNSYWYWNGTLSTGSPTTKISIETLSSLIRSADSDFHAWLSSEGVDGIYKDARGVARTSPVAPGAYDPGNEGQVRHNAAEDPGRVTVPLTD